MSKNEQTIPLAQNNTNIFLSLIDDFPNHQYHISDDETTIIIMTESIIDFQNLQNSEFFINHIEAHYHYWSASSSWKTYESGRVHHAFMIFISCKNTYYVNGGEKLTAHPGEVVYLPKGACYECRFENMQTGKNLNLYGDIKNFYYNGVLQTVKNIKKFYNAIYIGFDIYNSDFEEACFANDITKLPLNSSDQESKNSFVRQ